MRKRLVRVLLIGLLAALTLLLSGSVALAHGENSQEGFLRMQTAAFFDVQFSTDHVKQGEPITITGKVKVLETWPTTLKQPEVGYINIISSGPTFIMKEKYVNGQPEPGSIFLHKGEVYDFKMVVEGRRPGTWHIHPVLDVEGSGGLIGPGQWTTVEAAPGGFQNQVTLANGTKVDLETYGTPLVFWFSFAGFLLGVAWMLWWTIKHRTVTNLAVTSQIPLNDPGEDIGLITRADHKVSTILAAATLVLLAGGGLYIQRAYPVRMPQQVRRMEPEALAAPPQFADAKATRATYDPVTGTMVVEAKVTNLGKAPMQLTSFITSNLTFSVAKDAKGPVLSAEPSTVSPGQTATVKLTMQNAAWNDQRLVVIGRSDLEVAGMLMFESGGERNWVTVASPVIPTTLVTM